jgi:single-strand DNA-binding protein
LAEICNQYLGKGRKVYIEGRLQTRDWEAQDGTKRNRTEIIAENMIMLDRAPTGQPGAVAAQPPTEPTLSPIPQQVDKGTGDQEIKLEDIPF